MALKQQLRDGGRLVAVVRSGPVGRATLVTRIGDAWGSRTDFDLIMAYLPEFAPQPKFVF
jgi:protein-L-isoaspartate(D-aspartate) O-methyltransferase